MLVNSLATIPYVEIYITYVILFLFRQLKPVCDNVLSYFKFTVVLSLEGTRYQLASCIYIYIYLYIFIYIKYCLIYTVCVHPKFGVTAESGIYSYNQTKRIGLWPS